MARVGLLVGSLFTAHCTSDDPHALDDVYGRDARADDAAAASDARVRDASLRDAAPAETKPVDAAVDAGRTPDAGTARDAGSTGVDAATNDGGDAGSDAATTQDSGTGATSTTMPVASPPSYLGTSGSSSACTATYRTAGFAPIDATPSKHPLFLYFVGTAGGTADQTARYDCLAGKKVTEALARRGFVALSVEYDNQISSFFTSKTSCLFDTSNARSLLTAACALPSVDCTRGIATWGHSQGGLLAHAAANFDARVRAVWTTGYSGMDDAKLSVNRLRAVNGEADVMNSAVAAANKTTGLTSAECPDDGRDQCLRPDGSGWIVVRKAASRLNAADHCWFNKRSCIDSAETLEPGWVDADSTTPFALESNATWVASTVARP